MNQASSSDFEKRLLAEVSEEKLWEHAQAIAQWEKVSGTPGEQAVVDYLQRRLEEYGIQTALYRFESLLGWPEEAELEVRSPVGRAFRAITHSFTPSTAAEGMEGEALYLGAGEAADFQRQPVAGRMVVLEGMPNPSRVLLGQRYGVAAEIYLNDRLRDFCVSPVWGTPTTKTAALLPNLPVVSIARPEDVELFELMKQGPVKVWLRTKTFWGWRPVSIVVGEIPGTTEPDKFVLFSGHHCSWYYGAMDNGTANASMLESARLLSQYRRELRRSVRFAFWPGHTQGRYSGSTWYFDQFWEELHDRCVLHVNVDSTGARGAKFYTVASMPETAEFGLAAVRDAIGVEADAPRIQRAGDQSFWGCGVSSVFLSLSKSPPEEGQQDSPRLPQPAAKKKYAMAWFWHTPDDTIDKIDPAVLRQDTLVYFLATLRAATAPILPLRFSRTAQAIRKTLQDYQAAGRFDLTALINRAENVAAATAELDSLLEQMREQGTDSKIIDLANQGLMALGRALVLIYFSGEGPFEQDLAIPIPPVAALAPVSRLGKLDPASNEARFLATEMIRNRNKVAFYLREALLAAQQTGASLRELLGQKSIAAPGR
jgi:hypothetical protein